MAFIHHKISHQNLQPARRTTLCKQTTYLALVIDHKTMKFFFLWAAVVIVGLVTAEIPVQWYPPILGLNSTDCGLDCLLTGLRDFNVLQACLDQSQIDSNEIVYREDGAAYDAARQTLDGYLSAYPALVVYARSKQDVSDAVRCATEGGYRVSARSACISVPN
jgi:hypothetical protein